MEDYWDDGYDAGDVTPFLSGRDTLRTGRYQKFIIGPKIKSWDRI